MVLLHQDVQVLTATLAFAPEPLAIDFDARAQNPSVTWTAVNGTGFTE
jgi:hypothetical protein